MVKPLLSIVIISFNTADITINCLNSIYKDIGLKDIAFEIIVIDNASIDDSVKKIKKLNKNIRLFVNKDNIGFAKANNQAFKIATGNYILLLNSDTIVLHSAISQSLNWLSAHPEASMCTGELLNPDKTIQPSGGFFPNLLNTFAWSIGLDDLPFVNLFIPPIHPHPPTFYTKDNFFLQDHPQDWLTGAFILIRSELVQKTAGFDKNFFMYAEEVEWAYRIKKSFPKLSCWYLIGPQIIHLGGASDKNSQNKILKEYQGIYYFFQKHQPQSAKLAKLFLKLGAFLRSLINPNYRSLWSKI